MDGQRKCGIHAQKDAIHSKKKNWDPVIYNSMDEMEFIMLSE